MTTTITNIITDELLNPTFEMTRQYLKILEVEYEDNKPKIAKIDFDENHNQATAFIEVKNESFYLEFVFDTADKIEIIGVDAFPFVRISFMPTSEDLTIQELLKITSIKPTNTITKGDFFSNGKFEYTYNGLEFETFSEPGRIERKLNYLLDIFETDIEGIKELSRQTSTKDIFVTIVYHIGNGNFTGLYIDNEIINRLSKLGLELTFDIYATGKKFENE
ncbi:DUF4279 domain-containing protein [Lacihabitans sp. LS3-19]|uniref:DUF4279 domain-containing protein n=1 Tax=Lacihabitans sp. LS3-19 TaxID=2487335 RepID=UPI0020CE684C|nr:DUF4279 domain-containing protein [Lacihabitans sp. LS3-19]MCP9769080.1 DUF4279 domain-containing protein [Lacihabitans sp. LS3-19]